MRFVSFSFQVRRSLKIRGRRKDKEKLPSGITADYSAEFFAHLDIDRGVERDRGVEEVLADGNHTIDNNGDGEHPYAANISHSDSSETSLHSIGANKVRIMWPTEFGHTHYKCAQLKFKFFVFFFGMTLEFQSFLLRYFQLFILTITIGRGFENVPITGVRY